MWERSSGPFYPRYLPEKKKDGNLRTILNLKYLNKHVKFDNFKSESILDVFKII